MMRWSLASLVLVSTTWAADPGPWPQFRGPAGLGVADVAKVPTEFGPEKNLRWKVTCPAGLSSPIIAGDNLVLTAFEGGKLFTIAFARTTGKESWRAEAPAKKIEPFHATEGSPAASTCVTDGTRIVSYFGSSGFFCYDLAGKELWRHELPCMATDKEFGTGTSPILANGNVIVVRDQPHHSVLLAVSISNGSRAWETPRPQMPAGYSTPAVWNQMLVVPGYTKLTGYDLATGRESWTIPNVAAVNCATPIVVDGMLIYSGWSPGTEDFKMPNFDDMLKQFDKNGDSAITIEEVKGQFLESFFSNNDTNKDGRITRDEWDAGASFLAKGTNCAFALKPGSTQPVWRKTKGLPYVPSSLAYRGKLYLVRDGGLVTAYDVTTGKEIFLQERLGASGGYYASPVAAGGHIYLTCLDGSVTVITPDDKPKMVARNKLGERAAATPAIDATTLYFRTDKHLWAFAGP